jgi:hypothetical protein
MVLAFGWHGGSRDYSPNGVVTDPVTMPLQFRLLGRLEARHGGTVMPLLPGKRRAVLAALRGDIGRLGELTVALRRQRPPPSARMTVQNYVRRPAGPPCISRTRATPCAITHHRRYVYRARK